MPHNPPHDVTVDQARELLESALPPGWRVRIQSAITTAESEPEPEVVVTLGPAGRYVTRHPEIALVEKVADSSLAFDRGGKRLSYARARIICWIINLVDRQVVVYTDPTGPTANPTYRHRTDFGLALIPVANLLP